MVKFQDPSTTYNSSGEFCEAGLKDAYRVVYQPAKIFFESDEAKAFFNLGLANGCNDKWSIGFPVRNSAGGTSMIINIVAKNKPELEDPLRNIYFQPYDGFIIKVPPAYAILKTRLEDYIRKFAYYIIDNYYDPKAGGNNIEISPEDLEGELQDFAFNIGYEYADFYVPAVFWNEKFPITNILVERVEGGGGDPGPIPV